MEQDEKMYEVTSRVIETPVAGEVALDVVFMPREDWLPLVDKALAKRDKLSTEAAVAIRRTAETMPRFAMGEYIASRGCGCLVGEFLIAAPDIDRVAVARKYQGNEVSIRQLLLDRVGGVDASELYWLGSDIDSDLRDFIHDRGRVERDTYDSVVFVDYGGASPGGE